MAAWYDVFDGTFFISLATVILACLGVTYKCCYRAKCDRLSLCRGCFVLHRDTEDELRLDLSRWSGASDPKRAVVDDIPPSRGGSV